MQMGQRHRQTRPCMHLPGQHRSLKKNAKEEYGKRLEAWEMGGFPECTPSWGVGLGGWSQGSGAFRQVEGSGSSSLVVKFC